MAGNPFSLGYSGSDDVSDYYETLLNNGQRPSTRFVVPSTLATRYAAPASARPPAVQPSAAPDLATEGELEQWRAVDEQAKVAGTAANIAVNRLPVLAIRAQRAVAMKDFETLSAIDGEISDIIETNGDALMPYANMTDAGPRGKRVSELVNQVMSGQYRDAWGMTPLLDDNSEEVLSSRASRASKELGVPVGVARAMVDQNSPDHVVYGRFGHLLDKTQPVDPRIGPEFRDAERAYLRSVSDLDAKYGKEFDSPHEFAEFVSAFNKELNAKGVSAGTSVLDSMADAYLNLKSTGSVVRPGDFLKNVSVAVNSLADSQFSAQEGPATGGRVDGRQPKEQTLRGRMAVHEAQSLVSALISRAAVAGVKDDVTTGRYVDALRTAAESARKLSDIYGVDLRSRAGASGAIAELALSNLGVPGVSSDVADGLTFLTTSISRLTSDSTRKTVQMAQNQHGLAATVVDDNNPYFHTEVAVMKRVGRVIMNYASADQDGSVYKVFENLQNPRSPEYRDVHAAIAKGLMSRLDDPELAGEVADRLIGNLVGREDAPMETLEHAIRDIGAQEPAVAPGNRLSGGAEFNDKDIEILRGGDAVQAPRKEDGSPDGGRAAQLSAAQKNLALQAQKYRNREESHIEYHKAAGEFYKAVTGSGDRLVTTGLLGRMAGAGAKRSFSDRKWKNVIHDSVLNLISEATRGNERASGQYMYFEPVTKSRRAEILAELLIVAASGETVAAQHWPVIRGLAEDEGVFLPKRQKDFKMENLKEFTARVPELRESTLAKSGYLNLKTGLLDVKNLVSTSQDTRNSDVPLTPLQESARRAISRIETRDSSVTAAVSDIRDHLLSQGETDNETINTQMATITARLNKAFQRGGDAEVSRERDAYLRTRRFFVPVWNETVDPSSKKSSYTLDVNRVGVAYMVSDDEWNKMKAEYDQQYFDRTGEEPPEGWLDKLQTTGADTHRSMREMLRLQAQASVKEQGKKQADDQKD